MSIQLQSGDRKRVLMIALEFAPAQTTGMFRSLRFAKNLHKFGIDPVVVTINPEQACEDFGVPNNSALLDGMPEGVEIHHLRFTKLIRRRAKFVEFVRHWARFADGYYARLRKSMQDLLASGKLGRIDAIYVTLPPFGAGDLAIDAKRHFKKPLVVDMRDAWSQWGASPFPTYVHYQCVRQLERRLLEAADRIVAVTKELQGMLESVVGGKAKKTFLQIPNANDTSEFPPNIKWKPEPGALINIGYVGSFYFNEKTHEARTKKWFKKPPHYWPHFYATDQDWSYRTPNYFFQAWSELNNRAPEIGNRMRFHLVGNTPGWLHEMVRRWKIEEMCVFHGRLLKQDVAKTLANLDFLLSTSIKVTDGKDYCLASKSFEYVTSGKPTIGFVCDGSQKDFIQRSNTGVVFDPDDAAMSAERMKHLFSSGVSLVTNLEYLAQYEAAYTTRKMADCIISACEAPPL